MSAKLLYTGQMMDMHLAYGAAGRNKRMIQQWFLHHSTFMATN